MGDDKRLVKFIYNDDDAYAIEMGHQYMRFFKDQEQITTVTGSEYVVYTPYDSTDLNEIKYVQVVNDVYMVHPDYAPYQLIRNSDNDWDFDEIAFWRGPFLEENKDENITVSPSALAGVVTVTAVGGNVWTALNVGGLFKIKGDAFEEADITGGGDAYTDPILLDKGDIISIGITGTWSGIVSLQKSYDGGSTYTTMYQYDNNDSDDVETDQDSVLWRAGIIPGDLNSGTATVRITHRNAYGWGCITGYTSPTQIQVTTVEDFPSTEYTYKWSEGAFSDRRGFPAAVGFYKQRAFYANTSYRPTTFWFSVLDDYINFDEGTGLDDDGGRFTIASNEVNGITSFLDLKVLLAFTQRGVWKLSNVGQGITPTNVSVEKQTSYGANFVQPIAVGNSAVYVEAGGKKLRSLNYEFQYDAYVSNEISIRSEHILKDNGTVIAMDFCARPDSIIYITMSNGTLVTCLYDPSNKKIGFQSDPTYNGDFKSVISIPNASTSTDEGWTIIKRVINGSDKWNLEVFSDPYWNIPEEYTFLDSFITQSGTDMTTVSGLDHLEGEAVSVLIDGAYYPYDTTVSGGSITILDDYAGDVIHVGYPYTTTVQTMRLNPATGIGSALGKRQSIYDLSMVFRNTTTCKLGKNEDTLEDLGDFSAQVLSSPQTPYTDIITRDFPSGYSNELYVTLVSDKPLPFELLALSATVDVSPR